MNGSVNFREKITQIERLFEKEEYTAGARECVITIERALRQMVAQYLE